MTVLEPVHLSPRKRVLPLLAVGLLVAPRGVDRARVVGQAPEHREALVVEAVDDLAVVGAGLPLGAGRHDAHRAVAAARVVHRHLREGEADLVVQRRKRRGVDVAIERDVRAPPEAAQPGALDAPQDSSGLVR